MRGQLCPHTDDSATHSEAKEPRAGIIDRCRSSGTIICKYWDFYLSKLRDCKEHNKQLGVFSCEHFKAACQHSRKDTCQQLKLCHFNSN